MKKIFILGMLFLATILTAGTALNDDVFSATYKNLLWVDSAAYTGISASQQDVCDASGTAIGFGLSTGSIRFDDGYKAEWVDADMFIYNHSATGMTFDANAELFLLGSTEIDLTSALVDINVTNFTLNGAIATTGALTHTGTASFSGNTTHSANIDVDGTANLDEVDIDGATQIDNTVTVGTSGTSFDVTFHSDVAADNLLWDASAAELIITGTDGSDALNIPDGDITVTDDISGATITATTGFTGNLTGTVDLNGGKLILDADQDTDIRADTDDQVDFYVGDAITPKYRMTTSYFAPVTDDSYDLGYIGQEWQNLYIDGTANIDRILVTGDVAGSIDNVVLGGSTPLAGTFTDLTTTQDVIFNDAQADYDFRVESNNYDHTLFVEGGSDNVGIGDATPDAKLHIKDTDAAADVTVLKIERVSSAENDDDETRVSFYYTDSADNQDEYARISMVSEDVTTASEDGEIKFSVVMAGTITDVVTIGDEGILCEGAIIADGFNYAVALEGVADTYTMDLKPSLDAYTTGLMVTMIPAGDNSGACTLNIDGLGAKSIKTVSGDDPFAADINASGAHILIYDGTNFVLINPATTCD